MEVYDRITRSDFQEHIERIVGFKISRVWLGYANALFLEFGRLKKEKLISTKGVRWSAYGQITFMIEGGWRVEKRRSIEFGIDFSDRKIENRIKGLEGRRIASISTVNRIPELSIELDDGRVITTFCSHSTMPSWHIGFKDLRCIDIDAVWKDNDDLSVWLTYERGGFQRRYCFDEREFSDPKYLRKNYNLNVRKKKSL
ncbi:hypothetical protein ACFL02_01665 [Planctomycetota bacterium]